jgi:hypothetical protein
MHQVSAKKRLIPSTGASPVARFVWNSPGEYAKSL